MSASADAEAAAEVLILADDLIWSTRLRSIVEAAGGRGRVAPSAETFSASLPTADRVIVDLMARQQDPIAAVAAAAEAGRRTICVGQHDDLATRKEALAAGAERVFAYRKLFEDGPAVIGRWLSE